MSWHGWKTRWHGQGGGREVLRLAIPLILSNSFWTLQITIDRIFLSQADSENVGAAMSAVVFFWTFFTLFQTTAAYATTFVAQYIGAGQRERVGPVVWQSLYFSAVSGVVFLLLLPFVDPLIALGGHAPEIQALEAVYLKCLCFAALPMLLTAAATSFFLGRGQNWPVMLVNALGMLVNAVLDYAWIDGNLGFPAWGIEGAGWATVVGSWASALLGFGFLLHPRYCMEFAILKGWRIDKPLLRRMLWYGLPGGLQLMIEGLAFSVVINLIGLLGKVEHSATSIAFTLNLLAFLPTMGIGQAVGILVSQRLGENRPDIAERTTWSGFALAWTFMAVIGSTYVLLPDVYLTLFETKEGKNIWPEVAALVPILLRFVTLYCLFDSMNLVFSFALKGAGDTRFVTLAALVLAWPIMVLPTWAAWYYDWGLLWAWTFVSAYVVVLAFTFLTRFIRGKWKTMRVIEMASTESVPNGETVQGEEPVTGHLPVPVADGLLLGGTSPREAWEGQPSAPAP